MDRTALPSLSQTCTKCHETRPVNLFDLVSNRGAAKRRRTICYICRNAQRRQKYAADPQRYRHRIQQWRTRNHAKYRATDKAFRERNKQKLSAASREQSKRWKANHPQQTAEHNAQWRALKKKALINDLSHNQWLEIQEVQDHCCVYCGKRCKGKLTQDHITPLSKGGSHTLSNVIGACISCNSKKHTGPPPTPVQPMLLSVATARTKRVA